MPPVACYSDDPSPSGCRMQVQKKPILDVGRRGIGAGDTSLLSSDSGLNLPRLQVRRTEKRARCADCNRLTHFLFNRGWLEWRRCQYCVRDHWPREWSVLRVLFAESRGIPFVPAVGTVEEC